MMTWTSSAHPKAGLAQLFLVLSFLPNYCLGLSYTIVGGKRETGSCCRRSVIAETRAEVRKQETAIGTGHY